MRSFSHSHLYDLSFIFFYLKIQKLKDEADAESKKIAADALMLDDSDSDADDHWSDHRPPSNSSRGGNAFSPGRRNSPRRPNSANGNSNSNSRSSQLLSPTASSRQRNLDNVHRRKSSSSREKPTGHEKKFKLKLTAAEQMEEDIEIAAVIKACEEERDKQLQHEIRIMETESLRLERQWRKELEQQKQQALASVEKEKAHRERNRQQGGIQVAELIVLRESHLKELQQLKEDHQETLKIEASLRKEIFSYQERIAAVQNKIQGKEEEHRLRMREIQLEFNTEKRELQYEIDNLQQEINERKANFEEQSQKKEQEHEEALQKLDEEVLIAL